MRISYCWLQQVNKTHLDDSMANEEQGTVPLKDEDAENNTIFDNDSLEGSLMEKFTEKEETPEPETEPVEEPEEEQQEETDATEEEAETEETTENTGESDEEAEPTAEDEKLQKAFDKRIQRELTKLNKQYEDKFAALDEKLKEADTPTDALTHAKTTMDLGALDKIEADAEATIDQIEDVDIEFDSEHGENGATIGEKFYTKSELLGIKRNARASIKQVANRRTTLGKINANNAEIHKLHPALSDKNSPESLAVSEIYRDIPALKEDPQGLTKAIYMIVGKETLAASAKKPSKKKAAPKKAPSLPEASPTRKKSASKAKSSIDFEAITLDGGGQESLEGALLGRFG